MSAKLPLFQSILAQDSGMGGRKRPYGAPRVDDKDWPSRKWLDWFLENYSTEDLIPLGVWKAKRWIVADYGDNDEVVSAMRAAFALDGQDGAIAILGAQMVGDLPPGTVLPELPETWNDGLRYRYQQYRDPETRLREFGIHTRDK